MITLPTSSPEVAALKDQHRTVWSTAYAEVAKTVADAGPAQLLAAIDLLSDHSVLDVATGTGNVAIPAAQAGARVTGLDLAPPLLDVARARAAEAGVDVTWIEGDAEALPFADASFDRVLSVLGVQFAPRHEVVADELVRVCRPGGLIGLVNWTREGLIGRMFKVLGSYLPKPPEFASPPPLWGDEEHQRKLFAGKVEGLSFDRGINTWAFPSAEAFQDFFEQEYGPTIKAKEKLSADGRWEDCRGELLELFREMNVATDGTLRLDSEYLVTLARR